MASCFKYVVTNLFPCSKRTLVRRLVHTGEARLGMLFTYYKRSILQIADTYIIMGAFYPCVKQEVFDLLWCSRKMPACIEFCNGEKARLFRREQCSLQTLYILTQSRKYILYVHLHIADFVSYSFWLGWWLNFGRMLFLWCLFIFGCFIASSKTYLKFLQMPQCENIFENSVLLMFWEPEAEAQESRMCETNRKF